VDQPILPMSRFDLVEELSHEPPKFREVLRIPHDVVIRGVCRGRPDRHIIPEHIHDAIVDDGGAQTNFQSDRWADSGWLRDSVANVISVLRPFPSCGFTVQLIDHGRCDVAEKSAEFDQQGDGS
jgi:hypothetical protein